MKKGLVIKSNENLAEDIALINTYTRSDLTEDEVYTFSVVLCDNEVDRDYERFTVESLFALEKLFVGKTGIMDHSPKAENQLARIYKTEVQAVEGEVTITGDQYFRLIAKAYVPKTESTKDFISKLETGILKEVSVGCSVESTLCSICGNPINSSMCNHHKGEYYGDTLCYGELTGLIESVFTIDSIVVLEIPLLLIRESRIMSLTTLSLYALPHSIHQCAIIIKVNITVILFVTVN